MSIRSACLVCRSSKLRPLGEKAGFAFVECADCGHVFVTEPPADAAVDELYERYSYDHYTLANVEPFAFATLAELCRGFARHRRQGRLLDVGFGQGAMLAAARDAGWEPHGIEASRLAVEQAQKNGFVHAVHGDFTTHPYPDGHFDVITMFELLEHLSDAHPFLERAARLLAPGGLLYVTTPNGAGLSARVMGPRWSVMTPPEHIQLFTRASLGHALADAGFAPTVNAEGFNPAELVHYLRHRHDAAARSLANPLKPDTSADALFDRNTTGFALNRRLSSSAAGRLVKRTANATLRLARLGDTLKAWAVKPDG